MAGLGNVVNPLTPDAPASAVWPPTPEGVAQAAQRWRAGELVAFPTETVYGLGADATQDAAVAKVFAAKGRPSDHPLIVHVASAQDLPAFVREVPPAVARLVTHAWPGPLTLILPRRPGVAQAAAGGQDSVGVRCPSHPVAQALLRAAQALGVAGVAGPSANRFGRVSPTRAQHVWQEFNGEVPVVDGGDCEVGIESTIVDATRGALVILRPGHYTAAQLSEWAGEPVLAQDALSQAAPKASGTLASHYAPQARVRLWPRERLMALVTEGATPPPEVAVWSPDPSPAGWLGPWRIQPQDPHDCARVLFATLRELDASGVREIWVSEVPEGEAWAGVADRLRRAAA